MLGAALPMSLACGPTVVGEVADEEEADQTVWITTRDGAVAEVEEYLGPVFDDDDQPRLIESANGNSILLARESELEPLGAWFHDRYHRCGGFATHTSLEEAQAAIQVQPGAGAGLVGAPLLATEGETVKRLLPLVSATNILSTIQGLAAFPTRHYQSTSGVNAASWLRDRWSQMAAGRADVTVELFPHAGWAQPSVMLTIEGQTLPDEKVVIGGHLDSITFSGNTAPGADDDASGVASLTEVARILLADQVRLDRTVVFIAYAAEEVGLRGSNEIATQFQSQSVQVAGVMQLDMTNYNGTAGTDFVLLTDYTNPALTEFTEQIAATYLPTMNVARDACGYACSDHASWHRAGFPAVMPFESLLGDYNPNIHTSGDTLSVSGNNANHAAKFSRLALAWMIETAGVVGDEPPAGGVRLAQVAYDIPGIDGPGEFVELYNSSDAAIAVGGWSLSNPDRTRRLPAGASVPAHGYLTLARNGDGFTAMYGQAPDLSRAIPPLLNGPSSLTLRDAAGALVDRVEWETTAWPITARAGQSVVRSNPEAADTDTVADWSVVPTDPH